MWLLASFLIHIGLLIKKKKKKKKKISIYFIPLFIIPKKVNLRLNDTKGFSFYLSSRKDLFGKIAEKFGEQLPFSFFDS